MLFAWQDGKYLIDSNSDGQWDYVYGYGNGLSMYKGKEAVEEAENFLLYAALIIIILIEILLLSLFFKKK